MLKIASVTMSPFIRQEKAAKMVTLRSLDKRLLCLLWSVVVGRLEERGLGSHMANFLC